MTDKIENLLDLLKQSWLPLKRNEVQDMVQIVDELKIQTIKDEPKGEIINIDEYLNSDNKIVSQIKELTSKMVWNDYLPNHETLKNVVKICELVGPESKNPCIGIANNLAIGVLLVPKNVSIAQHAENSAVIYNVLHCGQNDVKYGPTKAHLKDIEKNNVFFASITSPKTYQAGPDEPLIFLYSRALKIEDSFWFSDIDNPDYDKYQDIMKIDDIHQYYLDIADDYDKVMLSWGYCMPDSTAEAIVAHGKFDKDLSELKALDLGCGDGLTGRALMRKGVKDITGIDFSENMVEKAKKRGCYKDVFCGDLLKKLPFEDNSFDILICAGVTTYINPTVLKDWIRVSKPNGIIAFTHRTLIWSKWEPEQEKLENEPNGWTRLWISDPPLPYLPSLKEKGKEYSVEKAKIYVYTKKF